MTNSEKPFVLLMADDNEGDRRLVKELLADSAVLCDLRLVEDGQELLDYLQHRGKYKDPATAPHPGLILLDLHMPHKDGHEALQDIRSDPDLRDIPVVVLTTSQEQVDLWRTYDAGIINFLTKPINPVAIENAIEDFGAYWRRINRA